MAIPSLYRADETIILVMDTNKEKKVVVDTLKNPGANAGIKVNTLEKNLRTIGNRLASKSKHMRELFLLEAWAMI